MTRRTWIALILVALVAVGTWQWIGWVRRSGDIAASSVMPTDDEIRESWRRHRAEFEELRTALLAEPATREIGLDEVDGCYRDEDRWNCPSARAVSGPEMLRQVGLSSERYRRITDLLSAVGAQWAAHVGDGMLIYLHGEGIVTSGASKLLLWSPTPPSHLVADTDRDPRTGYVIDHSSVGDGWYIEQISN